ncbi:MAG: RHS repeat protein [Winogradskyella sp.]|uniref:RHS repeat domain-containing protein n=1 Tax=Winogradskyella sp. TaxID=1883156 RepID=UPI0025EED066|nr:RHS repeat domain-containing protein [Winogradskyella sp.]NRB61367.1 RHS repeat protein [Winogradskyella sp.]
MKKSHFILLLLLLNSFVHAQFNVQVQEPKSPQAYLFQKYGNQEISKYNGRHSMTIPLYTISTGGINIPLNISYSSNGIRVDEEASRVGLGWYFNSGMISQNVLGKDDLRHNHQLVIPDYYWAPNPQNILSTYPTNQGELVVQDSYDPNRLQLSIGTPKKDEYSIIKLQSEGCGGSLGDGDMLFPVNGSFYNYTSSSLNNEYLGVDVERDIFQASFFGHNISFYLDGNKGRVLNNEKYKIEYSIAQSNPNMTDVYKWKIVDPSGVTYWFEEELVTNTTSPGGTSAPSTTTEFSTKTQTQYNNFIEIPQNYNPRQGFNYTSKSRTWKITKIVDVHGNEVLFEYEMLPTVKSQNPSSGSIYFRKLAHSSIQQGALGESYFDGPIENIMHITSAPVAEIYEKESFSYNYEERSILKRILFQDAEVEFQLSNRIDLPHDKKIDTINIKRGNTTLKSIYFEYSHFNENHTVDKQKRLRLDGVNVNGKSYSFEYNGDFMPDKNSLSFDYWGYYNGLNNQTIHKNPFRLIEDLNTLPIWGIEPLITDFNGLSNKSAHPDNCKVGMLNRIVYPTGGSTEFHYELNTFDNIYFPDYDNRQNFNGNSFTIDNPQSNSKGYGLRISKVVDYRTTTSSVNDIAKITEYTYNGGKHLTPYVFMNRDQIRRANFPFYGPVGGVPDATKIINIYNSLECYYSNIFQTSLLGNGNGIGYDSVITRTKDLSGFDNGRIESFYSNVPDLRLSQVVGNYGSVPASQIDQFGYSIRATDEDNGLLIKEDVYDANGNIKQSIEIDYKSIVPFTDQNNGSLETSYNVKHIPIGTSAYVGSFGYCNFYNSLFFFYPLRQTKSLIEKQKVTSYFDNGGLKFSETLNTYNNNYMLTEKQIKDESGNVFRVEETTYNSGSDIIGNNFFPSNNLNTNAGIYNILNKPNGTKIITNGETKSILNYNYNDSYKELHRITEYPRNDYLSKRVLDYDYDSKGNVLEINQTDGSSIMYVWGYGDTYPIAKIENASYDNTTASQDSTINAVKVASNLDVDDASEDALRTALDNLRQAFPQSMVSTYTYDPLIGVTSMTDSNGQIAYYEYDAFNRLKQVKDKDGNILSKNEYHYANQN